MITAAAIYGFCVSTASADTGAEVGANHERHEHSSDTGSAGIVKFIGWLGTSTAICSLMLGWLAVLPYRQRLNKWYRIVLALAVVLVSATGFFGGAMIYGLDQYAW
jgi:hypothetical protein